MSESAKSAPQNIIMKPSNHDSGAPHSEALKAWKVNTPLPAGFERRVWRSVEQAGHSRSSLFSKWLDELVAGFRVHRAFSVCFVALSLVSGIGLGMVEARRSSESAKTSLSQRYVQSIDPYLRHSH